MRLIPDSLTPPEQFHWQCTAQYHLVKYKDRSSFARFRDHCGDAKFSSRQWMIKLEDLIKQVPPGNRCVIWVYLYEGPNPRWAVPNLNNLRDAPPLPSSMAQSTLTRDRNGRGGNKASSPPWSLAWP